LFKRKIKALCIRFLIKQKGDYDKKKNIANGFSHGAVTIY